VDDLFELAVLDTPSPPLRLEPVPIGELVRDAASQYRDGLARRQVVLTLEIAPGLPTIRADGLRLIRLLNNLLSNADRHTPDGGTITLSARQHGELVEIRVRDTGDGLDPERIEHLFERYYRGSDARTRGSQGAGLGLSISQAIATAHGGQIKASNLEEGGAEFTLTLPVGEALEETDAPG
jgi:signal transduction histidine kinase